MLFDEFILHIFLTAVRIPIVVIFGVPVKSNQEEPAPQNGLQNGFRREANQHT